MTNIMAMVNNYGSAKQQDAQQLLFEDSARQRPVGIAMADSLGSNGDEVTRGNQKLFQAGKCFVMGTGAGDLIVESAKSLDRSADETPLNVAEHLLGFTEQYVTFQPGEMLNFIVAGYSGEKLEVYYLTANRIAKPVLVESGYAADGSGARFVSKAIDRDFEKGISVGHQYLTLADLAVSFFDLGHAATKSSSVDDLLQFGFFHEGNAVALMHPQVMVTLPPLAYAGKDGKYDPSKGVPNNQFYYAFSPKMYESWQMQRRYNHISSAVRDGIIKDRQRAFEELDSIASELASRRTELNSMMSSYCAMHAKQN